MEKTARREKNIHRQVLVVDDEDINRRLLGNIVSRDYEVLYASNGSEALEIMRSSDHRLSLVLLDLLMPEMDGYELLEVIKNDPELKRIPVIVLTSDKSAEVKSLQLGAVDFITKPYDMPEVIRARVRRSIELAEDKIIIHEAETDNLTGLYTKEFFYQYSIQHDNYCEGVPMDAIVLDINRFHLINELYGREYGNNVLISLADTIRETLNEYDGLACRSDADCFYVYIPHREDYESFLAETYKKFNDRLANPRLSVRLGIYENVDRGISIEQRFDRAMMACARQRGSHASSFSFYDYQLHQRELYSERLLNDMDKALEERQFVVFYQPKYTITGDTPRLSSAEALIRWFHPELGMVSPGQFIPLFEENGLIQKLDHYVWCEAAAQIRRWKEKYGRTIPVSVNVSRIDIYDPELESTLLDIVSSNGLTPWEYLLEITESAYTDNSKQIVEKVQRLREHGFRVEMDDFGSGYSSLNMLADLPIDALKLDMRFVRNITESSKDLKLVELVIDIARFLKVPVISEGVETENQMKLLKHAGCDVIQGYYFSKPVPPEEFNKLIEKDNEEA